MSQQEKSPTRYFMHIEEVDYMKLETLIFDNLKNVIPREASKTVVYANVNETSYEIFFYCLLPQNGYRQCYELAEADALDAHSLDEAFAEIAKNIKADKTYSAECNNLFTFVIDAAGVTMSVEHLAEDTRIYRTKKEWKEKNLH